MGTLLMLIVLRLAVRPPVEETSAFFQALLAAHGPDFFVPLFGHRAKNGLTEMGGVDRVSVAISGEFRHFHVSNCKIVKKHQQ